MVIRRVSMILAVTMLVVASMMVSLPAFAAGKGHHKHHKVTLCHKGQTIKVNRHAVRAHLRHGDTLGPCKKMTT